MKSRFFFAKRSRSVFPGLIALLMCVPLLVAASCSGITGSTSIIPTLSGGVTSSAFGGVTQFKMVDANNGWAATGSAVLKTSDGGQHWTDVTPSDWEATANQGTPADQSTDKTISAAFFLDTNTAWMISSNSDEVSNSLAATAEASNGTATPTVNAQMQVYVRSTVDGGHTWMDGHPITVTNLTQIYPPSFINQHEGWLVLSTARSDGTSNGGHVYHTTDGGITWKSVSNIGSSRNSDSLSGLTMVPNCMTSFSNQTVQCGSGTPVPPTNVQGCTTTGTLDTVGWLGHARAGSLSVNETTNSGVTWGPLFWNTPGGASGQTKDSLIVASPPITFGDGTGVMPIQMQSNPNGDDPSNFHLHLYKISYSSGVGASETDLGPTSPFVSQIVSGYHILSAPDLKHIFVLGQDDTNGTVGNTNLYEWNGSSWQTLTSQVNVPGTTANATPPDLTTLANESPFGNLDFISDTEGWITGGNYLFHITINGNNATWDQVYPQGGTATPEAVTRTPGQVLSPPANPPVCSNPTPTATSNPTPATTTTTNSNSGLPAHILTGYWQDFTNGSTSMRLSAVNANYDLIAVAFASADPTTPGAVTFSIDSGLAGALGGYTTAQFTSDIKTLHAAGKKVIISVGGQNGTVSVNDATSATNFANSVASLMTTYGFDGVDIDFENGLNPTYMGNALQQLSAKEGSGLIITLAPQTVDMQSTSSTYFQLALNIKNILTVVNMQYYNSGTMLGCDGKVYAQGSVDFLTAQACIQLQGGLRADQVGLGLPATTSAAGSGYVAPSVVNAALDCLAQGTNCGSFKPAKTYPTIRGAMTWSISWDAANSYNFATTVKSHLSSLP